MPGEEDRLESTLCEPACVRTQHGEKYFKTRAMIEIITSNVQLKS